MSHLGIVIIAFQRSITARIVLAYQLIRGGGENWRGVGREVTAEEGWSYVVEIWDQTRAAKFGVIRVNVTHLSRRNPLSTQSLGGVSLSTTATRRYIFDCLFTSITVFCFYLLYILYQRLMHEQRKLMAGGLEQVHWGYTRCDYFITTHCPIDCDVIWLLFTLKNGHIRLSNITWDGWTDGRTDTTYCRDA